MTLELLAPARNLAIGIAAIDCGADAVYIAGPAFGARHNAGNSVEDIRTLCDYAHRFGVRIYVTFNTLIWEEELDEAARLLRELAEAGTDAFIVQDPAVERLAPEGTLLHGSTQCAIRTPEEARRAESLGYGRLVLERQLSLEEVRHIRSAVSAELEFFVHGALCVCYSGQCYLSAYLTGRSANRGECAQACRSLYDLEDASGNVLERGKALLSLKDYRLLERLEDLAEAGVQSFKIEGRLKSLSYVRNVVRAYSEAMDELCRRHPDWQRSSFGRVSGGFTPDLGKAFNRGYTTLFLDGKKGRWASPDAATSLGEKVGTVRRLLRDGLLVSPVSASLVLHNGDGFSFVLPDGSVGGVRADVAEGMRLRCKQAEGLREGMTLYRNYDAAFERTLDTEAPVRELLVAVQAHTDGLRLSLEATTEDGRMASAGIQGEAAKDPARALESLRQQIEKRSGAYRFHLTQAPSEAPFLPVSALNALRRTLAEKLDAQPVRMTPLQRGAADPSVSFPATLSYKANVANSLDREIYAERGVTRMEPAYELTHPEGAELMRTRYCVRHELGLCPRQNPRERPEPLYLRNNGRRLCLGFDCARCEMTVSEA